MNYIVEYETGEVISSSEVSWAALPRDKKIISMGLYDINDEYHELRNYDIWFFSNEATWRAFSVGKNFKLECRMIGGFDLKTGGGVVIKVFPEGGYKIINANYDEYRRVFNEQAFIVLEENDA